MLCICNSEKKKISERFLSTCKSLVKIYDIEMLRLLERYKFDLKKGDDFSSFCLMQKRKNDLWTEDLKFVIVNGSTIHNYFLKEKENLSSQKLKLLIENNNYNFPCPFCCYEEFVSIPIPNSFSINGVIKFLPTFVVVDRRRPFIIKENLIWYLKGEKYIFDLKKDSLTVLKNKQLVEVKEKELLRQFKSLKLLENFFKRC